MPLPGVVVVVENEVAGKEQDFRAHLTTLAYPLPMQANGQISLWGQDGRVVFVRAIDDPTGYAGMVVVLQPENKHP
jgi:hypothetical protein